MAGPHDSKGLFEGEDVCCEIRAIDLFMLPWCCRKYRSSTFLALLYGEKRIKTRVLSPLSLNVSSLTKHDNMVLRLGLGFGVRIGVRIRGRFREVVGMVGVPVQGCLMHRERPHKNRSAKVCVCVSVLITAVPNTSVRNEQKSLSPAKRK